MLRDLKALSVDNDDYTTDDFRAAAAALLYRQFIHADDHGYRQHYTIITRHVPYFESLFDAINRHFICNLDFGYVGTLPRDEAQSTTFLRLRKDESLVLLCLRVLYEEGVKDFRVSNGAVSADSGVVAARYEALTKQEKPPFVRMKDILRLFARYGILKENADESESRNMVVRIRPTVRLITTDAYLRQLEELLGLRGADGESAGENPEEADE